MHTEIQGPYDNYACKECTEDLMADLRWENQMEALVNDPPYVEYPCPTLKEDSNA
jgi:hypothetical protein